MPYSLRTLKQPLQRARSNTAGDRLDHFVDAVYAQRVGDGAGTADLKLVYTPLNGSGLECL